MNGEKCFLKIWIIACRVNTPNSSNLYVIQKLMHISGQGRFEILSLSGSIMLTESGGQRSRTGGLSVSLAGPDGRVLGGGVAGLLTAAAPVQVSTVILYLMHS